MDFFGFTPSAALIYFDHKLADQVSIVQCIYNYGPLFQSDRIIDVNGIVKGTYWQDIINDYYERSSDIPVDVYNFIVGDLRRLIKEAINNFEELKGTKSGKDEIIQVMYKYGKKILKYENNQANINFGSAIVKPDFPLIGDCYKKTGYYTIYQGCPGDLNAINAACPPTFYRSIDYKYLGKSIKKTWHHLNSNLFQ